MKNFLHTLGLVALGCIAAVPVSAQVSQEGPVTKFTAPKTPIGPDGVPVTIDTAHPIPMESLANVPPASPSDAYRGTAVPMGTPGASPGGAGNGKTHPLSLPVPQSAVKSNSAGSDGTQGAATPQEFGTADQPFTTSRANYLKSTPYRASGKLFFNIGSSTYVCSASLIKKGIVVTAAHCVANYGQSQFYSNWLYVPAYNYGSAPYGTFTAATAYVLTAYYNGTDSCYQYGVICPDDVAVLVENTSGGNFPGTYTGWLGYGWNGWGFNKNNQALINQLGYPVALDGGNWNERNDSQGFVNTTYSNNTIIGSLMTGGSSGGPWVVNLGLAPTLSGGISHGTYASHNIVVGVTSWGYIDSTVKQQGASPFTSGNITVLVNAACGAYPGRC